MAASAAPADDPNPRRAPFSQGPKEKAPALSGRGFAVSAGRGRGCRSPRGVRAERRPRSGVPEKNGRGADKRSAPENAYRGASPTAAIAGDYLPSPPEALLQKSDSEKRPRDAAAARRHRRRQARASNFVNHILALDTGFDPRQSYAWGRIRRGESKISSRSRLGGFNRDCFGRGCRDARREQFLSIFIGNACAWLIPSSEIGGDSK